MSLVEAILIFAAGVAAGTINTVVGSGSLVTFPTLLFFGYPPVVANVSNTVGLVFGGLSGSWGYRRELTGLKSAVLRWVPLSAFGAIIGALLLLVLDPSVFSHVVPVLIALGVLLVLFGPRLTTWAQRRGASSPDSGPGGPASGASAGVSAGSGTGGSAGESTDAGGYGSTGVSAESRPRQILLAIGVWATAIYGGYFGAAQGVILMGIFSTLSTAPLQVLNAIKNVLATVVNSVAAVVFIIVVPDQIDWAVAGLIAIGALCGGVIGARVGRLLPPNVLRTFIAIIGVIAILRMITTGG